MTSWSEGQSVIGFRHPVHQAQQTFRACLAALSQPGLPVTLKTDVRPPAPLNATLAALLLTLADSETGVWLDTDLAERVAVVDYLRFHTGCSFVARPSDADFAVISNPAGMPRLSAYRPGTQQYPDTSTTVLIAVDEFTSEGPKLTGPGIAESRTFWARPLPATLDKDLVTNRAIFPLGVDLILAEAGRISGLPRSTILSWEP